jgi:thiol-disulfide isomerase/thioredoxin
MKTLFFVLGLIACKPSVVDVQTSNVDSAESTAPVVLEPVGVIPGNDCRHIDIGDTPCNFRLLDQNAAVWDLYSHTGDVIVLIFSTSWCGPCQSAGNYTESIQTEFASEGVQYVTVLIDGYTPGTAPETYEIDGWVNSHNINTASILQGSREKMIDIAGISGYSIGGFPTYIYIGRDMKFYAGHVGFSEEYIKEKIQEGL